MHINKLSYCRNIFMHRYKNNKLPPSFSGIFTDIVSTDELQTRHSDYNINNLPAIKRSVESFPYKQIIANWSLKFYWKIIIFLNISMSWIALMTATAVLQIKMFSNMNCLPFYFNCLSPIHLPVHSSTGLSIILLPVLV